MTFNGAGFDLRFLKNTFPEFVLPPIHIDLRWVSRRLGYIGGLKELERSLGISRKADVSEMGGFDATVLWAKYLRGDNSALDQLIEYNTADVVHLKAIMEICYDKMSCRTAEFLLKAVPCVFTGVGEIPKSRRPTIASIARKVPIKIGGGDIVSNLLEKASHDSRTPRIVGIDLTGSERRATGWALLDGSNATTKAIHTDEDLLAETLVSNPDVVSIDSPLSMPEAVTDPENLGSALIYRRCELALKRMGIHAACGVQRRDWLTQTHSNLPRMFGCLQKRCQTGPSLNRRLRYSFDMGGSRQVDRVQGTGSLLLESLTEQLLPACSRDPHLVLHEQPLP